MKRIIMLIGIGAFLGMGSLFAQTHPALGGGTGTSADPYQIQTPAHLKDLADFVNGGRANGNATAGVYYIVINDLDLTAYAADTGWNPIGYYNIVTDDYSYFGGNFNGNGKKVTNLKINRPTTNYQGLFGIASGADIKNLGIENCDIAGISDVGGLAGYNTSSSTISNCYATGNVSGTGNNVGGLAGYNYSSTISNCYAAVNVSGTGDYVGGLVGENNNSTISNCYVAANVSGTAIVGGLAGYNYYSTISNCYATGKVSGTLDYVGGLAGNHYSSTIKNCVAANDSVVTTASTTAINRICGLTNGTFQNNYALSTMVVKYNYGIISITDGLNTEAGMGILLDSLQSLAFYATAGNWIDSAWSINDPSGVWKICDGENMFPFLRWQGINCNPTTYTITATAGANGSITPAGAIDVEEGKDQTFTFTANSGYEINQVLIDDTNNFPAVAAGTYTFTNIQANHKIEVYFKTTVGIKQLTINNEQLTIYPNPTNGQLRVSGDIWDGKDREIIIYDVVGQVVFTSQLSELSPETTIDISCLANGLYFLKVNGKTVKIIKE